MTVKNHYGVWVDCDIPTTGVVSNNQAEWLHEEIDAGIDLDYETLLQEYETDAEGFFTEYYIPDDEQEGFDFGEYMSMVDTAKNTILIGSWKQNKEGLYEPDESGEYSAIVGEVYTQVVFSQYVTKASLCSPCYPGQADVPSDGEHLAYTLPPEVWGDGLTDDEKTKVKYHTLAYHIKRYMAAVDSWIDDNGGTVKSIKRVRPVTRSIINRLDRLA